MDGQLGAHQKQIIPCKFLDNRNRTFLADQIRNMLKSPHTPYRIYNTNKVTSDCESLDCFRQRKPGLFHLVKDLYLDQLAVGGGDGTGMLRRVKKAAVRVGSSGH
jgi:hypothetical protein